MNVPLIRLPRPVSAPARTNVALAASGRKSAGYAGVTSSSTLATSSREFVTAHHRFGSSSYFRPPNTPARSVANYPTPSFRTHFVAAASGSAPGVDPIPSATRRDCDVSTSMTLRNMSDARCQRMNVA